MYLNTFMTYNMNTDVLRQSNSKTGHTISSIQKTKNHRDIIDLSTQFISNSEFIKAMNVHKRTAQTWRDEGKIAFIQIGYKIYYLRSDVDDFVRNFRKATK